MDLPVKNTVFLYSKQLVTRGVYPRVLFSLLLLHVFLCNGHVLAQQPGASQKLNVLFIAVDDLRPDLGCYGVQQVKSPQIDRLAQKGMVFQHAYCQSAICAPSRASLLSGLRPDFSGVNDLFSSVRTLNPDIVTLPELFKKHGYQSVSLGKVYHNNAQCRDPQSWTEKEWSASAGVGRGYQLPENQAIARNEKGIAAPYEAADVPDTAYGDGKVAAKAIQWLQENGNKPFFLAVGFEKPHLPFNAPKKYWDLYDSAQIKLPDEIWKGVVNNGIDKALPGFPDFSNAWGELTQYHGIDKSRPIPPAQARMLKWGYYASLSYMDAQVGKLMDALDQLGLAENTIVILWGDHGYKLGEYGGWAKHTNLDIDTRAPLIMYLPGMKGKGRAANSFVEFIDVYPTLAQAAGLPLPGHLQGKSFLHLLHQPDAVHKEAAYSQFTDWNKTFRGYSVRTSDYRYTAWYSHKGADSGKIIGREWYDLKKDKEERNNLAVNNRTNKHIQKLHEMLIMQNRLERFVK